MLQCWCTFVLSTPLKRATDEINLNTLEQFMALNLTNLTWWKIKSLSTHHWIISKISQVLSWMWKGFFDLISANCTLKNDCDFYKHLMLGRETFSEAIFRPLFISVELENPLLWFYYAWNLHLNIMTLTLLLILAHTFVTEIFEQRCWVDDDPKAHIFQTITFSFCF